MRITQQNIDQVLNISIPMDFKPDLGREDGLKEFENETLKSIINPIENYETVRFVHNSYVGEAAVSQCDIWYHLYFYNNYSTPTHIGGLDYSLVGISDEENAKMLKQSIKSFFRLEFYKVPSGENPEKMNRRLVFSRNLSLPLGEKVLKQINSDTDDWEHIYVPVFTGNNFRNKENMYLFWFQDDTVLNETMLTGDTFFMTARFFNADDGSIINFGNKSKSVTSAISENNDIYYEVVINKTNYTYEVYEYNGVRGDRIGQTGNPIKFYEIASGE